LHLLPLGRLWLFIERVFKPVMMADARVRGY